MGKFFDVKYLLDMKDADGLDPEIYIVCSRVRGPGKTTSIGMHVLKIAMSDDDGPKKFVLICRKKSQVGKYADGCLKGCLDVMGSDWSVSEEVGIQGLYSNIYLERLIESEDYEEDKPPSKQKKEKERIHVGYVIALRGAYEIKNISSLFVDSWCSIQDEFILQDEAYLPNEPVLLQNLHTSLARGGGKSIRYYPHFMMANCIDVLNPYFIAFGLVGKLQSNTRKFRGHGLVYMRYESNEIAQEHAKSAFNRAFAEGYNRENDFLDNSWLVDTSSLVTKPDPAWGQINYMCQIHDGRIWLRIGRYSGANLFYMDYGREKGIRTFAVHEPDPGEVVWDAPGVGARKLLREKFKNGNMRFRTEQVKRDYMEIF